MKVKMTTFTGRDGNSLSEVLVAETVPETLTKEKQKLIINKSNCEHDNCESVGCGLQPNRCKATDNTPERTLGVMSMFRYSR